MSQKIHESIVLILGNTFNKGVMKKVRCKISNDYHIKKLIKIARRKYMFMIGIAGIIIVDFWNNFSIIEINNRILSSKLSMIIKIAILVSTIYLTFDNIKSATEATISI